jgi:hypothetical protein
MANSPKTGSFAIDNIQYRYSCCLYVLSMSR